MKIIEHKLTNNELVKAARLLQKAAALGMDVSSYGCADVNMASGNVYLWFEDYPFCLYIGLCDSRIYANWADTYDGEEHNRLAGNSLSRLYKWAEKLQAASERMHEPS